MFKNLGAQLSFYWINRGLDRVDTQLYSKDDSGLQAEKAQAMSSHPGSSSPLMGESRLAFHDLTGAMSAVC